MAKKKQDIDGRILTNIIEETELSMKEKYYILNGYLEAKGATWTTEFLGEPKSVLLYVFYYGSPQLFKYVVKSNEKIKEILSSEDTLNPVFLSIAENPYGFDIESQVEYINLIKSCSGNNYKKQTNFDMKSLLKTDTNINFVELLLLNNNPGTALQIAEKFKISISNEDMKNGYMHKFCTTVMKRYSSDFDKPNYAENINKYIQFLEKQGCAIKSTLLGSVAVEAYDYLKNNHDMKKIMYDFLNLSKNEQGLALLENVLYCYGKKHYDWLLNTVVENDKDRRWQDNIYKFLDHIEIGFLDSNYHDFHEMLKARREKVALDNQFSDLLSVKNIINTRL